MGLRQISDNIRSGETTAQAVVAQCLEKARSSENVFIVINNEILDDAREIDRKNQNGISQPTLSGLPITLKDLFDVKGEVTLAGSVALRNIANPADDDCDVVASLARSGILFAGRVNMSEFAFSGMGLNPHFGNPKCIWDRQTGRIPGGSSSGSAVSVAEGIVMATMGSDTAGSCRIPAAFNGVAGVKPSYGRYSLNGVYPLSPSSDAPGPLAVDVDSCFVLDQIITGAWDGWGRIPDNSKPDPGSLTLLVPQSVVTEDLDNEVSACFEQAVKWLGDAGVTIKYAPMPVLDKCVELFLTSPVVGYEAWQQHKSIIEKYGDQYDPFVLKRILKSKDVGEDEQKLRYQRKAKIIVEFDTFFGDQQLDGIIYPTVPCVPPSIAETVAQENMMTSNLRFLRNTATVNNFNGCAISIPIENPGDAPVGLMVSLGHGEDEKLYGLTATLEKIINSRRFDSGAEIRN